MPARPKDPATRVDNRADRNRTAVAVRTDATVPRLPASLKGNPTASAVWKAVWRAGGQSYNPATDAFVIERYAELQSRREAFIATLDAEGWISVGSTGQVVAHPAAKLLENADAKLQSLEDRLGLNPEARIRLSIGAVERESKLAAFLRSESDPEE